MLSKISYIVKVKTNSKHKYNVEKKVPPKVVAALVVHGD